MWEVEEVRHVRVFAPPAGCALCQAVCPHPTMSILRCVRQSAPPAGCALCQAVRPRPTMSILRSVFANNLVIDTPSLQVWPDQIFLPVVFGGT